MAVTCVQLCIAGGLACGASLLFEDFPDSIEPSIWGWFAASAVLATSLRYVMQTLGQKGSSPANAALIMLLEPIWTVIFSVLWYGEQLSVNKYIGCSFILISLLYYRTDGRFIRIRK
jgi:drug/metabolite transporter (DMT)-like permease